MWCSSLLKAREIEDSSFYKQFSLDSLLPVIKTFSVEKDPIIRLEALLRDEWQLTYGEKLQIEKEIQLKIEAAVAFAEASPLPDPNEVTKDVYL